MSTNSDTNNLCVKRMLVLPQIDRIDCPAPVVNGQIAYHRLEGRIYYSHQGRWVLLANAEIV